MGFRCRSLPTLLPREPWWDTMIWPMQRHSWIICPSFGYIYGRDKKIRVNTYLTSPTVTTAGNGIKGKDTLLDWSDDVSPRNATADECADYCITLFSALPGRLPMQKSVPLMEVFQAWPWAGHYHPIQQKCLKIVTNSVFILILLKDSIGTQCTKLI
jgi:hypothetical protein